jgi:hypothetical protein
MKSVLIVALLTFLRLGIPAALLLIAGETIRQHFENTAARRGAR